MFLIAISKIVRLFVFTKCGDEKLELYKKYREDKRLIFPILFITRQNRTRRIRRCMILLQRSQGHDVLSLWGDLYLAGGR